MLGAAKQKGCFLYTSKTSGTSEISEKKYFDLSPALFGALYGYADKFSSATIKKHLSKRSHLLKLSEAKLLNFFRSQLQFLLQSCDGKKLPDYFCPILISNHALLRALKSQKKNQEIIQEKNASLDEEFLYQLDQIKSAKVFYDHDFLFDQKKREKPYEVISVVLSLFPYFAEIILHLQEINISPAMLLSSFKHSFFLGNYRLAIIDTRNDFSKEIVRHAANDSIDFWQLYVYIDIIKHHHKKSKVPSYQKKLKSLNSKIEDFQNLENVKVDFPKIQFPTNQRFFNLHLENSKMQNLIEAEKKTHPQHPKHSQHAQGHIFDKQQRLFFRTLSVVKNDCQLQIALALSQEWHHLEGRIKKLKQLLENV